MIPGSISEENLNKLIEQIVKTSYKVVIKTLTLYVKVFLLRVNSNQITLDRRSVFRAELYENSLAKKTLIRLFIRCCETAVRGEDFYCTFYILASGAWKMPIGDHSALGNCTVFRQRVHIRNISPVIDWP
ncbi:hypothetical protein POTOM_043897 [Populus tomentosa]|uniref:Uncharacterized protein n=1 Tax=Populus tomentosa TaxID=118781 RepID=A0A8X7YNH7_POPTO|nr:hypothetical protein POTOM_043897 [Populus tomentosa]